MYRNPGWSKGSGSGTGNPDLRFSRDRSREGLEQPQDVATGSDYE